MSGVRILEYYQSRFGHLMVDFFILGRKNISSRCRDVVGWIDGVRDEAMGISLVLLLGVVLGTTDVREGANVGTILGASGDSTGTIVSFGTLGPVSFFVISSEERELFWIVATVPVVTTISSIKAMNPIQQMYFR